MENKAELIKERELLKKQLQEIETKINKIPERQGVVTERLGFGDVYYMIDYCIKSLIVSKYEINNDYRYDFANQQRLIGTLFYDQKSCQNELDKRLFLQEYFAKVRELNKKYEWVADWNDHNQRKANYIFENGSLKIFVHYGQHLPTQYYFCLEADSELREHFGDRLKLLVA